MSDAVVIDTSVLLSAGRRALYSFGTKDVVLPLAVVRELEGMRHNPELGYASRSILRTLDDLMRVGELKDGISLGEGYGSLRVEVNHINDTPVELQGYPNNDTRIITVAYALSKEGHDVTLVTKDIPMRALASLVGVKTESFGDEDDENLAEFIRGVKSFEITQDELESLYSKKKVVLNIDVPMNTGVVLRSYGGSALAVAKGEWSFELIKDIQVDSYVGRNTEQKIAVHHLTDESIGVVSLSGPAGSGKSFWMLAAALALVEDRSTPYEKIVVFRPVNPVGGQHQDLGYLPGTLDEKLAPHIQAVYDTLGTIRNKIDVEKIKRSGVIEFASISHVRGRTLANCIVICDELQNVEATTILTLISRLGVNARLFIGWDTAQRDANYIGKYDGIYKIVKKLLGHKLFAHVTLRKSERSAISEMVSGLLDEV